MKLGPRDAAAFFNKPDTRHAALLIYGPDSMRVALKRQQVINALIGDTGEEEMRLTRTSGAELRKDPASLEDALKAQGFFPGQRVVFLEEATDGNAKTIAAALDSWRSGDAMLVVTAGQLAARSALRKLFEGRPDTLAAAIYADPPSRAEIQQELARAGIANIGEDAMTDLTALAQTLDPGDFRQTLEKLALYKLDDDSPVSCHDIAACAPATSEAMLDDALNLIAEGKTAEVGPIMQRLEAQGMNPTSICIGAMRHFRLLHAAASNPRGIEAGLSSARPPVFGPRRDRMARQARALGVARAERIITILTDTDLDLRSARPVPQRALVERAFIRIAMLARQN